jgi:hypothetical protein
VAKPRRNGGIREREKVRQQRTEVEESQKAVESQKEETADPGCVKTAVTLVVTATIKCPGSHQPRGMGAVTFVREG